MLLESVTVSRGEADRGSGGSGREESKAFGIAKIAAEGLSFFVRLSFWEDLGHEVSRLSQGAELDEGEGEQLVLAAKATEAEARGASLLGRAEQPRFLLRAKLIDRGYPPAAAEMALDRLEREGLLSDRRYAEAWLRSRVERAVRAGRGGGASATRAEGPSSLLLSLRARSVSEKVGKEALTAVLDEELRHDLLVSSIAILLRGGLREGDELRSRLRELGWKGEELREALSEK